MSAPLFTPERKLTPYWWDTTPRPSLTTTKVPGSVDALVIGSGYTGLHAALQVARGGRSTLVVDAEDAGWGCSTRNGGQISTSIKPGYDELSARHGAQAAHAILSEGQRSLSWIGEFIAAEKLDCNFGVVGRFHAAHNAQQFAALAQRIVHQPKGLEVDVELIPRSEQHRELGTDVYHGGVVYTRHASLDPGRYHQGLLDRVIAAGATVVARCPVRAIDRDAGRFRVQTALGVVTARDVVVATNGYTGKLQRWSRSFPNSLRRGSAIRGAASSRTHSTSSRTSANETGCITRWGIAVPAWGWPATWECGWASRCLGWPKAAPRSMASRSRRGRCTPATHGSWRRRSTTIDGATAGLARKFAPRLPFTLSFLSLHLCFNDWRGN